MLRNPETIWNEEGIVQIVESAIVPTPHYKKSD